jgi:hypothetical protein
MFFFDFDQGLGAFGTHAPSRGPTLEFGDPLVPRVHDLRHGPTLLWLGLGKLPRSRAARHVVRWDEYKPCRRSNAPTAPGVLQAAASRTIFRLYSTVNRRRVAFATTSIAGPPKVCSNALITL